MEHYPLVSFPSGLEITYSDLKHKMNGSEYVTLYFEQPNRKKDIFCSAEYDYPGGSLKNVKGYSDKSLQRLLGHVAKVGHIALDASREKTHA